jgi:hypothetical protein
MQYRARPEAVTWLIHPWTLDPQPVERKLRNMLSSLVKRITGRTKLRTTAARKRITDGSSKCGSLKI